MPSCMICKKRAYSGYVLCPHCAKSLEDDSLSPEVAFVLDRLAEEVAGNESISACSMCEKGACDSQISGLTCRAGVKSWLVSKAMGYLTELPGKAHT